MLRLQLLAGIRILARYRRRWFERLSPSKPDCEASWIQTVDKIVDDLEALNCATEREFLEVGARLLEFRSTARRIASELSNLSGSISGEQDNRTSGALAHILQRSRHINSEAESTGQHLAILQNHSGRIPAAFSQLRSRVLSFRTLCTLIRIESSRIGHLGTGFEGLAEAVKPLSEDIHVSGEHILEASIQLDETIREALRNGSSIQTRQIHQVHGLIENVGASLQALEERRRKVHEASLRQSERHHAVCEAIDRLVESVQFHDITRQQIEHVIDSLRQIRSGSATHPRIIIRLQISQLCSAETAFTDSVERIRTGLNEIAAGVREMAQTGVNLIAVDPTDHDQFFEHIDQSFAAIGRAIAACSAGSVQIQTTATGLTATMERMLESVREIERLEIEITRIALNASIHAAQIGGAGNALNSIADGMHGLVQESRRNTQDAKEALEAMADCAATILQGGHPAGDDLLVDKDVLAEFRTAFRTLQASRVASVSLVHQIRALGAGLDTDVHAVLEQFTAGKLLSDTVNGACAALQRVEEEFETDATEPQAFPLDLENFASRYTMQAERDVHRAMADRGASSSDEEEQIPVPVTSGEADFGQNVEFF